MSKQAVIFYRNLLSSEYAEIDICKSETNSELKSTVASNDLPDGIKAIVSPEFYKLMLKQANQSQLTIPKSIADMADKTDLDKIYCFDAQEFYWRFGHDHDKYVPIIFIYLAGKALGGDLVKVVEG